jgi:short-subunit dehydrogenase
MAKTILITGASSGTAKSVAIYFAGQGGNLGSQGKI